MKRLVDWSISSLEQGFYKWRSSLPVFQYKAIERILDRRLFKLWDISAEINEEELRK